MSISNKTIPGVDLPVYEFLRPTFSGSGWSSSNNTMCCSEDGRDQFMFSFREGIIWRYDAYSDNWSLYPNAPDTGNYLTTMTMNNKGTVGQIISGTPNSAFLAAANNTKTVIGKTIRITKGPGKNQERVITDVIGPTVDAIFVLSTGATNNSTGQTAGTIILTDSSSAFSINQYKGYEAKIIGNTTGYHIILPVLSNTATQLYLADPGLFGVHDYCSPYMASTPTTNQQVLIQKSEVIVDSPWDEIPTSDSYFEILDTGAVYMFNNRSNPFNFYELDRFASVWYYRTVNPNKFAQFGTDYVIEDMAASDVPSVSSVITSATSTTFYDSVCSFSSETFKNFRLKIESGTGKGQIRAILSAGPVGYTVNEWDVTPDNTSVYTINNPYRSILLMGSAEARIYRYDINRDAWTDTPTIHDWGFVSTLYCTGSGLSGVGGIPITTITRSGTTATVTTARGHLIQGTPTLTIGTASDALYNGNFAVTPTGYNTFTYVMGGTPGANAVASNTNTTTVMFDLNKNWTVDEHAGKLLLIHSAIQTNQWPTRVVRRIVSNTSNSITVNTSFGFTPSNGARYFILPIEVMGRTRVEGDATNKLAYGICTSSGTTTITDSTKSWKTNVYANNRVLIVAGTGAGSEATISSNTATALTISSSITTDTSSVYVILASMTSTAGMLLKYTANTTNNRGRYVYYHRGGNTSMFEMRYDVWRETFEQATYLNPLIGTGSTGTGQIAAYDWGDRLYFNTGVNSRNIYYINLESGFIYGGGFYPYSSSNNGYTGTKNFGFINVDNLKFLYYPRCGGGNEFYRHMVTY